jgi:5-methylthioadenosine/S-adenosylhomocysteine deaminase
MAPVRDPIRNLVYSAERGDVDRVVIDGRDVLVDGRVQGLDERALARDAQRLAEELWQALGRDGEPSAEEISPSSLQPFLQPNSADNS